LNRYSAGEDGTDDAFASVIEILRRRLGGRGAGDTGDGAFGDNDEDDGSASGGGGSVSGGDGGGGGSVSGGGDAGGGGDGKKPQQAVDIPIQAPQELAPGEAKFFDPPPVRQLAKAAKVPKRRSFETSPGWHPRKKAKRPAAKKKGGAKETTKIRNRKLLEAVDGNAAAAETGAAAGTGVVKPMPSACTRSSAAAAGKGRVPVLCYSHKQRQPHGMEGFVGCTSGETQSRIESELLSSGFIFLSNLSNRNNNVTQRHYGTVGCAGLS
jgi:hypothetical protein